MLTAVKTLKVWWPWAIVVAVVALLSYSFYYFDRIWLAHNDELEGCRHWCQNHTRYDTPDKYVACVRQCKEAIDDPRPRAQKSAPRKPRR